MAHLDDFKAMVRSGDFLVLDTETTGLHDGEICQIAIVSAAGETLLDTLVKTCQPIPPDATNIHGITDYLVKGAPTWSEITDQVKTILQSAGNLVVYNAVYDRKMMHKSAERAGLPKTEWKEICKWWCAMEAFAEEYGDWNDYHGSYRWQRLTTAARHYGIQVNGAHSALGDCLMTLAVVKAMAAFQE